MYNSHKGYNQTTTIFASSSVKGFYTNLQMNLPFVPGIVD
jgi:hypothetical protein